MPKNPYISIGTNSEQNLLDSLTMESISFNGIETFYVPREIVDENEILNSADVSKFSKAFSIEMYLKNVDGYEGDGNLLSTFGLQVKNQIILVLSRNRWKQLVGKHLEQENQIRPKEGDLIYVPMVNGLFEILFVNGDTPFYQLSHLPSYEITCELFQYNNEEIDTGFSNIDDFERKFGTRTILKVTKHSGENIKVGENVLQKVKTKKKEELNLNNQSINNQNSQYHFSEIETDITGEVISVSQDEITIVGVSDQSNTGTTFQPTDDNNSYLEGTNSFYIVNEVINDQSVLKSKNEQNQSEIFEKKTNEILDFDEKNPFGEP